MSLNKVKVIIIILLIIVTLIVATLLSIMINRRKEENTIQGRELSDIKEEDVVSDEIKSVTDPTMFYTISDCINRYLTYVSMDIEESRVIKTEEAKKEAIYSMLERGFISDNNINIDSLYEYIKDTSTKTKFTVTEMNMLEGIGIETYSAYGRIENKESNELIRHQYFIVVVDRHRRTFCLKPIDASEYQKLDDIKLERKYKEIRRNGVNEFRYNKNHDKIEY